jgi:hypothetical protein
MADETDTGSEHTVTPPPAAPLPASAAEAPKRKRGDGPEAEPENSISPALERDHERLAGGAPEPRESEPAASSRARSERAADLEKAANDDEPARFSVQRGDVPDALKRRYFSEEPQYAPELRFYTDATTKDVAFRDAGDKLVARQTNAEVVRDLVSIAEHRGWKSIDVRGQEDFRREVWLEARTAGLEVRGHKPSERDLQELERRLSARDVSSVAPGRERNSSYEPGVLDPARTAPEGRTAPAAAKPERIDYDRGFTGKLLETGEAPYKHRAGQELTPYVRVEQANGRQVEIWGVGLPDALERAAAKVGDEIMLRRDGVERVMKTVEIKDRETGEVALEKREVPRNRWIVEAERFRASTPAQAARDPDLRDAQSRLAVVAAVVKDRHADPAVQDRLIASAKEQIAGHIEQGARFAAAMVREPETAKERPANERVATPEGSRGEPSEIHKPGPERTRGR